MRRHASLAHPRHPHPRHPHPRIAQSGFARLRLIAAVLLASLALLSITACDDEAEESPRLTLDAVAAPLDASEVETDLGYTVKLTGATLNLRSVEFTVRGDLHTARLDTRSSTRLNARLDTLFKSLSLFTPAIAHAHPGHAQLGDITGELPGDYTVTFGTDETPIGTASLLAGTYTSANLKLFNPVDTGHGITLTASATGNDGTRYALTANIAVVTDSTGNRDLVGIPFAHEIAPDATGTIAFHLLEKDPYEDDTLFDGVDFAKVSQPGATENAPRVVTPSPDAVGDALTAYEALRRTLQLHDQYEFTYSQ